MQEAGQCPQRLQGASGEVEQSGGRPFATQGLERCPGTARRCPHPEETDAKGIRTLRVRGQARREHRFCFLRRPGKRVQFADRLTRVSRQPRRVRRADTQLRSQPLRCCGELRPSLLKVREGRPDFGQVDYPSLRTGGGVVLSESGQGARSARKRGEEGGGFCTQQRVGAQFLGLQND